MLSYHLVIVNAHVQSCQTNTSRVEHGGVTGAEDSLGPDRANAFTYRATHKPVSFDAVLDAISPLNHS
jgi:hypothetical protein